MADVRQQIAANAEIVIDDLAPLAEGVDFGLNPESVQWLDGFIERYRAGADFDVDACGGLVNMLGCFLGECIVANAVGSWRHSCPFPLVADSAASDDRSATQRHRAIAATECSG